MLMLRAVREIRQVRLEGLFAVRQRGGNRQPSPKWYGTTRVGRNPGIDSADFRLLS